MNPLDPTDPKQLGRYRLTHCLGEGGMGRVYLGRTLSGRKVVVKTIRAEHVRNPEFRARFTREVEMARRVGGFHTAQVVEADTETAEPWVASDYIQGPSLGKLIATYGPLTASSLRVLAAGLTEGLQAIHADKLTHRDLKPANILVAQDGPRIIDFGIARPDEDTRITHTGALLGTPSYMAPEQVQAKDPQVSPAVDIFALGTVLHFAATGSNPFKGETALASVGLLLTTRPDVPESVPEPVRTVVSGCWRRVPEERITAEKILALLDGADPDHTWPPRKSSTGKSVPTPASRVWTLPRRAEGLEDWSVSELRAHAQELNEEAQDLRDQYRTEEALEVADKEVALYRVLSARHPETYSMDLVRALRRNANDLSTAGQLEEAIDAGAQAVKLVSDLSRLKPATYTPELVKFLGEYSSDLSEAGQHEQAAEADARAIGLIRRLLPVAPATYTPELAASLHNLSDELCELGRHEEAIDAITESCSLFRDLTLSNPKHYLSSFQEAAERRATLRERRRLSEPVRRASAP